MPAETIPNNNQTSSVTDCQQLPPPPREGVEFDFDKWFADTCSKETVARFCRNREQHLNCRLRRGVAKLLKKLRAPNGHLSPIRSTPVTSVEVDDLTGRPRGWYKCVICGNRITVTAKMAHNRFIQWVNSNIIRHMDEVHPSFWTSREIIERGGNKEATQQEPIIVYNLAEATGLVYDQQEDEDDTEMNQAETDFIEPEQTIREYIINFECY